MGGLGGSQSSQGGAGAGASGGGPACEDADAGCYPAATEGGWVGPGVLIDAAACDDAFAHSVRAGVDVPTCQCEEQEASSCSIKVSAGATACDSENFDAITTCALVPPTIGRLQIIERDGSPGACNPVPLVSYAQPKTLCMDYGAALPCDSGECLPDGDRVCVGHDGDVNCPGDGPYVHKTPARFSDCGSCSTPNDCNQAKLVHHILAGCTDSPTAFATNCSIRPGTAVYWRASLPACEPHFGSTSGRYTFCCTTPE